jgi:nucleoside-triphosphatase
MNRKVLLTGRPGCGKTTLIKHIVEKLGRAAGGFYTEEIRRAGSRVGFKLVTLNGEEAVLAHVDLKTPERVSKYGLDLSALDVAVEALRNAVREGCLVVIDEIGPMEIRSAKFRAAVMVAFDSGAPILGTIFARPLPFSSAIKSRPDVTLVEVHTHNRDRLVTELAAKFTAARKG